MDSMPIRDKGFEIVLEQHPREEINQLMNFHRENGGLSRYVKFRYFFEEIKKQEIDDEEIQKYADLFSEVMLKHLIDEGLLIADAIKFTRKNYQRYSMHVVSGSDQKELRRICRELEIEDYFISIHGSPVPKKQLVKDLLSSKGYDPAETILIGDSINDYDAARVNGISFYGYNNPELRKVSNNYIEKFS